MPTKPGSLTRAYHLRLGVSMLAYVLVTFASVYSIAHLVDKHSAWRWPIAIAPVVPLTFALFTVMWFFRRIDELQLRVQMEGLAFAFAGTAMITITVGFLENAGVPRPSWIWVWPVMGFLWGIGAWIARRRYQ